MFTPFANQNQFDPDAGAFINVTGIGGIQAVAINNLVNQLKTAGLWNGLLAIYPMVGGTAYAHKFNLKNPQDTNAAYRLSFAGGWTHNSSGAKPDGVSGTYADTFLNQSVSPLTQTNGHISYYSFTNNAGADDVEIGAGFSGGADVGESLLATRFSDNNFYTFWYHKQSAGGGGGTANTTSAGFYIANKAASTEGWKNGTRLINTGTGAATIGSYTFYLGAQNNGTTSFRNSTRGCCFASIGNTLPTGGAANLTNIVNTFNITLQRNVF
jgi:hypothetical protein